MRVDHWPLWVKTCGGDVEGADLDDLLRGCGRLLGVGGEGGEGEGQGGEGGVATEIERHQGYWTKQILAGMQRERNGKSNAKALTQAREGTQSVAEETRCR